MYYEATITNSMVLDWKSLDQRNRIGSPEIDNKSIKVAFQMIGEGMSGLINGVGTVIYPLEGKKSPTLGSIPKVISKWIKCQINKIIKILVKRIFLFGGEKRLFF